MLTVTSTDLQDKWVMDSRCTFLMTPRKELLLNYRSDLKGSKVLMGKNMSCNIIIIGSIKLKMCDGTVRILNDVRHISNLKRTLISLGVLDQNGCYNNHKVEF